MVTKQQFILEIVPFVIMEKVYTLIQRKNMGNGMALFSPLLRLMLLQILQVQK